MSTKNSLIAFLFLASPVWSQQQVAATGLQTPNKLILTPTLARASGLGAMALRDRTPYLTSTAGTYIHNPQGASSPIFVAVAADRETPFKGSLEGVTTITPIEFTVVRPEIVNLSTSTSIGSFAFTAANGDTLTTDFIGQASPTATPGVLKFVETAAITGGTGRFAGATGSFIVTGSFDFATNLTTGSFEGTISSPGAKHASSSDAVLQN